MEITRENTGELTATIKVVVQHTDYDSSVSKMLKELQHKAKVPGFRPGHVPFGLIKQQYGPGIIADEVNKLVSERLVTYLEEEKLNMLGQPISKPDESSKMDLKDGKDITFAFEIGFAPEFEVILDENLSIDYHVIDVDDTMIDKYVTDIRKRYGTLTNPEVSDETDVLFGEFRQLDEEGNVVEPGINHSSKIAIDTIVDTEIRNSLLGLKVGDVVMFDPQKATQNPFEAAHMLGINRNDLDSVGHNFRYTVLEISTMTPAELTEELYENIFPEQGISTIEEFRERLREDSMNAFVTDSDHLFTHTVQEKLLNTIPLSLPDDFLKRMIGDDRESRLTQEDIEREYPHFANSMKWQLISEKIIKEGDIKIADEEINDYIKDYFMNGWRTMPLTDDIQDRLDAMAEKYKKDRPQEIRHIRESLLTQRIAGYVKSKVTLNKKAISYDEFLKLDSAKHS